MIIVSGFITHLVTLLAHHDMYVVNASLCALGSICSGSNEQKQAVLNHDFLNYVKKVLKNPETKSSPVKL